MRKKIAFLFLLAPFFLFSQQAPNFNLITSEGNEIQLYKNYLEQGKTVVIEIFFVNCPPCRRLAPHMSTLYKDLQTRGVAVEFISLSTSSADTDEDIEAFKQEFEHPWPFVGNFTINLTALNQQNVPIVIPSLESGLYLLQIMNNKGEKRSLRFVKQ